MPSCFRAVVASAALLSASAAAPGLVINPTFDSSVTSSPDSAAIQSAVNYAAQQLENQFSDAITINIRVVAVPGTSVLGMSSSSLSGPFTYAQIRTALLAHATTANDTVANASLGLIDPTGGGHRSW